ncbi:ATP-binding protein [Dictyobacter formicarum]|uniref:Helicase HerA central domain-containing protein n=1 Tax=Dictyobacter formicarum TaxID=2778368 RepID=A0ABQ3V993_9CHLR|nr:ATP-binding protein [Dictyobacter formicarum]GHO82266.1 hypothetical protein KSZ_02720 [Dictyobacter formicarum]
MISSNINTKNTKRVSLLAEDILSHFKGTQLGHCARVNYLSNAEANALCQYINTASRKNISAYVLTKQNTQLASSSTYITVDKAIELRNRKEETLCLFVPADLIDAAYSSLGNSFAIINGQELHTHALKRVMSQLPVKAARFVRATFSQLRGSLNVSDNQKLDFAMAVLKRAEELELQQAGLELWRVGLISDATVGELVNAAIPSELDIKLEQNRRSTLALARPTKIDATTRDRIQNLKVDGQTALKLNLFFKGRSLNDVQSWSRALAEKQELTFDTWVFPASEKSDIREIKIKPFVNAKGEVEKACKLIQPDGARGSLIAKCAPKEKLAVSWISDPVQPENLGGWRVAIVPADSDFEVDNSIDLPERDLPASRRTITINMDIAFEEPPDFAVCVRVMPINKDGTVIVNEDGDEIYKDSGEFYLSKDITKPETGPAVRDSKFVVPNLAYGRLSYCAEVKDKDLTEAEPQWSNKDLAYFNLRLNERHMLQVGISQPLLDLERRSLAEPRKHASFVLDINDIHTISADDIVSKTLSTSENEIWSAFWKTRDNFFTRLRKTSHRDVVEVAEWTTELVNAGLRYAQAYKELLEDLLEREESRQELLEALSIDSVLVRIAGRQDNIEEAVVTLPIHPLRVAWMVSYTQLLQTWETKVLAITTQRERKYNLDLQALSLLTPINVPPFAYHVDTATTFTFFQNLRFFHGVSLPAGVPDPHRRYGDVGLIFGMAVDQSEFGNTHPEQLAEHLRGFLDLHDYTNTLVTTLVNPDRGDFFAEALKQLLPTHKLNEDDETQHHQVRTFQITAYTDSRHKSTLQAIEQVRQLQIDQQQYRQKTDHFLPGITTTSRKMEQLGKSIPEAHIAVVTDITRPAMRTFQASDQNTATTTSFSLYGLVVRFVSRFSVAQDALRWQHRVVTEGVRKPETHPAGIRYSELLIELQTAMLDAGGCVLSNTISTHPALEVTLGSEQRQLLERLHESTNWVVTLDRFFTLDYYDSPNEPELNNLARKYVLDYSPEFTDGLGHRMMVTTAWHEEIQSLLSQAMNDLGFTHVDQSVSHLLHHLKTISGRLALQALESSTTAAAAVGLGVVTAWLQQKGRLKQAVLIPVDTYPRLFSLDSSGKSIAGERRCDLVLISLKRNIVDATFIEVKWRRGRVPFEDLSRDMVLQMKSSATIMRNRFFNDGRVDGALQRSYLANVLRFYFERSRRYQLFDPEAEHSFLEHVSRLEKTGLDFRPSYEGYIVSLEGEERKPFPMDEARITVLTAKDFEQSTEFSSQIYTPVDYTDEVVEDLVVQAEDENDEDHDAPPPRPVSTSEQDHQSVVVQENEPSDPTNTGIAANQPDNEQLEAENDTDFSAEEHTNDKTQKLSAIDMSSMHAPRQSPIPEPVQTQPEAKSEPAPESINNQAPVQVSLGEAVGANLDVDWQPAVSGSPHLFVLGIPGQGKSWTVTRLLTELGRQQVPALVLDFHGQFADPSEPFVQAINPTVLDAARGLPFSPFECSLEGGSNGWQANSYAVAEIFGHVVDLGNMQRDVVFSAIRDAYKDHGFSDDPDQIIKGLTYPTLAEVLQNIETLAQARRVSNVAARCRPLLEMNLFRPQEQAPDLLTLVRSGLVVDLHNLYVETLQQAAGAFVLRKIYKDMFSWGYAKRLRLAIVLDEAHRLAKDVTLPKIMREGRKFGIAVIVASQGMADFHPDVLGTAGTKVIFRMNFPDSKKVAGFIRGLPGQDLPARIEQLGVGTAYVQTPEMSVGSVVKMHPLK